MAMDDMPVIMDAAWNNGFHAAQGVLAGANFVVADSFVIALKQTVVPRASQPVMTRYRWRAYACVEYSSIVSRSKANAALEAWNIEGHLSQFCSEINSVRNFCQS